MDRKFSNFRINDLKENGSCSTDRTLYFNISYCFLFFCSNFSDLFIVSVNFHCPYNLNSLVFYFYLIIIIQLLKLPF